MISVIVPCYNSTPVLKTMVEETIKVLDGLGESGYEFILVNDCSPDPHSMKIIEELAARFPFVKAVDLAKNTGQANAQITALRYAQGDIILNLDDDMQTHPKNIPILLDKLAEGYDLVIGSYPHKKHSFFRNFLTRSDEVFAEVVLGKPKGMHFTSFWVTRKHVRDALICYNHPFAFMEGLFLRTTSSIVNVPVEHFERSEGHSGYTFAKLFKVWSNFTNFTALPLRIAGIFGTVVALIGFILSIFFIVRKLVNPAAILTGYTSLLCVMLLFFGIVLMFMGLMGEYIGRIFMCINAAPQQVVRRTINMETEDERSPAGTAL